jgi:pimeloyl-ACP methyl ester carboxylesterase
VSTRLILVPGTWHGDWVEKESPFRQYLEAHDFRCLPFRGWSGDVDGIPAGLNLAESKKHSDWIAGGWSLMYLLRNLPYEKRNVIAHSHGGQVAIYAAALARLQIHRLVTVCTPVRKDMAEMYAKAKPLIGRWRHVSADGWDFMQRAGELFDGNLNWTQARKMPEAHENVLIKGIGHSKLLYAPECFPLWEQDGMLDFLRAHEVAGV